MSARVSEGTASARRLRHVRIGERVFVDTGALVIGRAFIPRPPVPSRDEIGLQEALLDPRTALPASTLARVAGAVVRWL